MGPKRAVAKCTIDHPDANSVLAKVFQLEVFGKAVPCWPMDCVCFQSEGVTIDETALPKAP